jgi:hypothetical protein
VTSAQAAAKWRSESDVWLDHASLRTADVEWLLPAKALTLWSVKVPDGLLASLPNLTYLDVRGGSGTSLTAISGCRRLRYLQVNQVRGLTDLAVVPTLTTLELLSLYGLPKVTALPSFAPLGQLLRAEVGSMKGLAGLTGLHDAPALAELLLIRAVAVAQDDAERLSKHPTLRLFEWYGEDVPARVWSSFCDVVNKPKARAAQALEWIEERGGL